jgi:hypothetical protein
MCARTIRPEVSVLALLVLLAVGPAWAQPSRSFDTDGDGQVELTIFDSNGDGFFEWPSGTRSFPGRLEFTATDRIAFAGSVTIQTGNGLFYAAGSRLVTLPGTSLSRIAVNASHGDIGGRGFLDLAVTGDVRLTAAAQLFLFGTTHVTAGGTITLVSSTAAVQVAQLTPDDFAPGAFALLAGRQLIMTAKGNASAIFVERVRIGSRVITIGAQTSSTTGVSRFFLIRNDALVTTNPARTGLVGGAGDITLRQQRDAIRVRDQSIVDSGRNLVLRAEYGGAVCLTRGATLAANGGAGTIDVRGVAEGVFVDPTSALVGSILGSGVVAVDEGC